MNENDVTKRSMNTSQQIRHVYGCESEELHLTPGFMVLRQQDPKHCAKCGKPIKDMTNTPVGQQYLAFARPDLGRPA